MPTVARLRVLAVLPFGLLLVFAAGCSSGPEPGRRGGPTGHHGKPPTPMAGQDTFFDGKIVAALSVGAMEGFSGAANEAHGEKTGGSGEGGGHGRRGGGEGGMSFGMGGGGMGGGRSDHGGRGGSGDSPRDFEGEGGGRREGMRPTMGSMGPPVMIHLRFTNQGPERVQLHIVDFSSPLGNFAVQPEILALDPGQSLETEPMSSQLAGSLTETDATLVLRIGDKNEKKIVILHAVPAAAPVDGAAPPPGDAPVPAEKPGK